MIKPFAPKFDGPIPSQSWQHAPRTMPYDRPPQFADVNTALKYFFKKLRRPDITKQILNLMDAQIPIDFIVENILVTAFREGTIGASTLVPCVGPMIVMLLRMGDTAGVKPIVSTQKSKNTKVDPMDLISAGHRMQSTNIVDKALKANGQSAKELNNSQLVDKQGFAAFRPKPKNGGLI